MTSLRAARRRPLALVWHQVHFDLRSFVRNRQARFYTIAMPVSFLVLFVAIFGNGTMQVAGHTLRTSTYYVANLTAFGIVDAAFMALTIGMVEARESGVLRRRQATPAPAWVLVVSRAAMTILSAGALATVLLVLGRVAYSASLPLQALPALVVAVALGCLAACTLGFAATTVIRSSQSAQPAVMAMVMPLFFISGVFVPWPFVPGWLRHIALVFPVRHLAVTVLMPFAQSGLQGGWRLSDLAVVGAWGLGGLVLALRHFRWAPQDM